MKRIFAFMIMAGLLVACQEDTIGQYPIDSTAPAKVTNPQVENLPGRVLITYELPDETDLLYVKAVYTKSDGTEGSVKASVFNNQVEIVGFGRSKKQTVKLITVDRSQNESDPVPVEIEPLDGTVYSISETMTMEETWGGIKMRWDNPQEDGVFITVTCTDSEGKEIVETYFSESEVGEIAMRDLDDTPYEFKIEVRDLYDNYSDARIETLTPWKEIMVPLKEITVLPLASNMTLHASYSKGLNALIDNVCSTEDYVYIDKTCAYGYFTFDLGAEYVISRVRMWHRYAYCYTVRNPKFFQYWTTNDWKYAENPDNWDGWNLVYEGKCVKPSGDGSTVTAEDKAFAMAGHEFEMPEGVTGRYFRVKLLENWTGNELGFMLAEIHFWGKKIED